MLFRKKASRDLIFVLALTTVKSCQFSKSSKPHARTKSGTVLVAINIRRVNFFYFTSVCNMHSEMDLSRAKIAYQTILDAHPNEDVLLLPNRRGKTQRPLVQALVKHFHPEMEWRQGCQVYENNRKKAKATWALPKKDPQPQRRPLYPWRGQVEQHVSLKGPFARPMPVQIPKTIDPFLPINNYIMSNTAVVDHPNVEIDPFSNTKMVRFERGIVYSDGRLDLCKQVLGPLWIVCLLKALARNRHIKHFLIGNNVVSSSGALAIAKFIQEFPNRMETWYLAGCHITSTVFSTLVDAMVESPVITNVWLKRNPLGVDSVPALVKLITNSPQLRTLDLHNTELGDEGVQLLMDELSESSVSISLKNLYLNANGIGVDGMAAIVRFLESPRCQLEALFISANPIGDEGIVQFTPRTFHNCPSLQILSAQSCGLTSRGIKLLAYSITVSKNIKTLHLGLSKIARPMGQYHNYFDASSISAFKFMIENTPSLRALTLDTMDVSYDELQNMLAPVILHEGAPLVSLRVRGRDRAGLSSKVKDALRENRVQLYGAQIDAKRFEDTQEAHTLHNIEDIKLIDSYYRNAGRSCDMKQYWDDGDPDWQLIIDDVAQNE